MQQVIQAALAAATTTTTGKIQPQGAGKDDSLNLSK
jgi:hypothetical protein